MSKETLERQLFDWTGWDGDIECMTFYNCTLKVPIGPYKIGDKFSGISILWVKSLLQIYEDGNDSPAYECELELSIGKQI